MIILDLENSAPVWIPDRDAKTCMCCAKAFNMVQRRHHCRYCGKVVCGGCSSQTLKVSISNKPVRVCKLCYDEMKKGAILSRTDSRFFDPQSSSSLISDDPGEDIESSSDEEENQTDSSKFTQKGLSPLNQNKQDQTESPKLPKAQSPKLDNQTSLEAVVPFVTDKNTTTKTEISTSPKVEVIPKSDLIPTKSDIAPKAETNGAPSKPSSTKPSLKPKPTNTLSDVEQLRLKIDVLTKLFKEEFATRTQNEKAMLIEMQELRNENKNLQNELEWLKQKILFLLDPPTRDPPPPNVN